MKPHRPSCLAAARPSEKGSTDSKRGLIAVFPRSSINPQTPFAGAGNNGLASFVSEVEWPHPAPTIVKKAQSAIHRPTFPTLESRKLCSRKLCPRKRCPRKPCIEVQVMKSRSLAIVVLILVLPVISCSRGPKYEFPLVQKYTTQAGDVFYFRPRDGQFVLVERRKALAVAIAPEPNIEAFSYDDRVTVSRPMSEGGPQGGPQGEMLENRTFLEKLTAQQILAISADGRLLAGGDANGVVNIWNVPNATLEARLKEASGILSLTFSADGNFLAIGLAKPADEPSDTVWIYDIRGESTQRGFGRNAASSLAWSVDGRWCAAGFDDGSVLLAETGTHS